MSGAQNEMPIWKWHADIFWSQNWLQIRSLCLTRVHKRVHPLKSPTSLRKTSCCSIYLNEKQKYWFKKWTIASTLYSESAQSICSQSTSIQAALVTNRPLFQRTPFVYSNKWKQCFLLHIYQFSCAQFDLKGCHSGLSQFWFHVKAEPGYPQLVSF